MTVDNMTAVEVETRIVELVKLVDSARERGDSIEVYEVEIRALKGGRNRHITGTYGAPPPPGPNA